MVHAVTSLRELSIADITYIPYNRKMWRELNLADWPPPASQPFCRRGSAKVIDNSFGRQRTKTAKHKYQISASNFALYAHVITVY